MSKSNSDYKTVWNALSSTESEALMQGAGYTDEALLDLPAGQTLDQLSEKIGTRSDDTYLEIDCGVGRVGRGLAPFLREWIWCDASGNMIEHARLRLDGVPNVRLVELPASDLSPIPDASVDAVYCTIVLMHLQEWDRRIYVREAHRILKPGGRFFCDNINLVSAQGWELFLASAAFPVTGRPAYRSRCSTVPEIETLLRMAGFSDVRTDTPESFVQCWGVN